MPALNEDRILDFLDGRLNAESEEELLHTLAVSPERRQMLREHLKLRELTTTLSRQDRFSVPAHVTTGLFQQLTALGFTAPVSTEAILTNAPALVRARKEEERPAPMLAPAVSGGWGQLRVSYFAMACLVSFMLGVGAFYVFGSSLGLRSISQQEELEQKNTARKFASIVPRATIHEQFNSASVSPIEAVRSNTDVKAISADLKAFSAPRHSIVKPEASEVISSASWMASGSDAFPDRSESHVGEGARAIFMPLAQPSGWPTADAQSSDGAASDSQGNSVTEAKPIPGRVENLPAKLMPMNMMPLHGGSSFPMLNEKGTISFRFGTGRAPGNTTRQWSSLSELKFTWTLSDYVIGRASLGQFISWQREADTKPTLVGPKSWQIGIVTTNHVVAVAGAELGLTLDPIGIPVEISGGVMADGVGQLYPRAALLSHFELFDVLNLGIGVEGMIAGSSHDIGKTITESQNLLKDYHPAVAPGSPQKETVGFVGFALELGWHF